MNPALEFDAVRKEYRAGVFRPRRVLALDDFSLRVERGEIFGFLGPNGAGKTTAIHLAMGFMRASGGSGRMLGQPFGDAATRRRVGFLPENVALYHRPVPKLLRFYGALNGLRDPALALAVRNVVETLELTDVRDRNVGKFSRGMQQRVGLAQALVNDPELLILDEPTSALDPLGRVAVRELLQRARAAGKTIFLSSHLLSEIELVCDRIAILHRGGIARTGSTASLLESRECTEIIARGIPDNAFPNAVASDGVVKFTVAISKQREAIERIWSAGGELVSVSPARRSLEEVFLELTGNGREAVVKGQASVSIQKDR
ncbi:MAG: ABC transporter ATP-binding protein [Candidatus Korobacteraceae bacterium]